MLGERDVDMSEGVDVPIFFFAETPRGTCLMLNRGKESPTKGKVGKGSNG